MSDVLRGNFTPKKAPKVEDAKEDLTDQFEREALRRLGGSIAFVSKRKFLYGGAPKARPEEGKGHGG